MGKKVLFWSVLVAWIGITLSVYILGFNNVWIFHDESLITYTTSGMTVEQASELRDLINFISDDNGGRHEYKAPVFIPLSGDSNLLGLGENNIYAIEYEIFEYESYGLEIKDRGQGDAMVAGVGMLGAFLLVVVSFFGMVPLHTYLFKREEWDRMRNTTKKPQGVGSSYSRLRS